MLCRKSTCVLLPGASFRSPCGRFACESSAGPVREKPFGFPLHTSTTYGGVFALGIERIQSNHCFFPSNLSPGECFGTGLKPAHVKDVQAADCRPLYGGEKSTSTLPLIVRTVFTSCEYFSGPYRSGLSGVAQTRSTIEVAHFPSNGFWVTELLNPKSL